MLRHSTRAPARRGGAPPLPGREGRDRPADRERLLLRLRVPGADRRGRARADRGRAPARARRGARPGSAPRSRPTTRAGCFEQEGEPYKVELVDTAEGDISLYTQGDFTDLCRGPHLQNSAPIKAVKLTGLAGAYWRGDEKNKQLTRIYGTAFYSQADLDAYLDQLEEARKRDHRRLGPQLDLFHFDEHSPGSPFWHPKGMVIWNVARGPAPAREPRRAATSRCKTPLIYDKALWVTSGHWEKFRENMFLDPDRRRSTTYGIKPMNCPGPHAPVRERSCASYRELPIRYAEAAPLHRNELGRRAARAHCACASSRRTTRTSSAPRTRSPTSSTAASPTLNYLYGLFGLQARAEFSTRPDNKLGSDEEWDFSEGASRGGAASATGSSTWSARARARSTGRRSTST